MFDVGIFNLLKSYIRDHKKIIIFFVSALLIFVFIIYLYELPLAATGYTALLCTVLGFLFFIYDFCFYLRQSKDLMRLYETVSQTLDGLPKGRTSAENNYMNLLVKSHNKGLDNEAKLNDTFSQMIDYFTMWAHQIKTPIAGIRLMLQAPGNRISKDMRKDLTDEVFKIEQYVDMVLSYMRLESNSTDYVIKEYDLDKVIRQAVRKFSGQFINKKISLNYEGTKIYALTDEKWLSFALDQLIANALKYTESGSITIRSSEQIVTEKPDIHPSDTNRSDTNRPNTEHENTKILIIEDTGIGIAPEDLPRVFEKGYTGYNGRIEKTSTGIGLFLTKMILTRLGHSITIESAVGKGTRVILDLSTVTTVHDYSSFSFSSQ